MRLLNICMGFRTFWPKISFFGGMGKIGKGVGWYWPITNSFYLLGVLRLCHFGENRSRNATAKVPTDGHTDWQTDTNRFYNLSHAICYSYATDKNGCWRRVRLSRFQTLRGTVWRQTFNFDLHSRSKTICSRISNSYFNIPT